MVAEPPRKLVSLRLVSQRLKVNLETAFWLQAAAYHVPVFSKPNFKQRIVSTSTG